MQGVLCNIAIRSVLNGQMSFCKFLSANDTGATRSHQSGVYIGKPTAIILFDELGRKGENKEKWVKIRWQNDLETDSRFIYYGRGTRNEYRITNFGSHFPFLTPDATGSLLVFVKRADDEYQAFILDREEDIDFFLETFGISPADTNRIIDFGGVKESVREQARIEQFIASLAEDFPDSRAMAEAAREIQNEVYNKVDLVVKEPDRKLIDWIRTEYSLFRAIENARYGSLARRGFETLDEFLALANTVLNRRKSRAGKSLEHHLSAIFDANGLLYESQATTEGNKRPDFLFPSRSAYLDRSFPTEKLITLAAKTTCKDRWRQILNEADRLRDRPKFLCTLQQGISPNQMDEMEREKVILVAPKQYINSFPEEKRDKIWTLGKFVGFVKEQEGR